MLSVPDDVWDALGDSAVTSFPVAVAQYQGAAVPLEVDPESGGLTWDANGEIQCNGSIRVFGFGSSLVPKSRDAMLAPTGQEVTISRVVRTRSGDYTIPLGVFRITGNDGGRESYRWESGIETVPAVLGFGEDPVSEGTFGFTGGGTLPPTGDGVFDGDGVLAPSVREGTFSIVGPVLVDGFTYRTDPVRTDQVLDWEVSVDVADRMRMLQRAKIINPASPPNGATVYSELQRLGLFPLERSLAVDDAAVPQGTVYEDRRSAVSVLAELVGGKPRVTRQGALTVRPADRWLTEPVPEFELDGVIEFTAEQSDEFYNFVWAHSPNGEFSAFASLTDDSDPRSVGRAGPSTYEHSSPVYTSTDAAQAGARTALSRLLNRRSRMVTVQMDARGLLLDLSDFGRVTDPATGRSVLGEVSGIRISHDPTAPIVVSLIVAEES